ncbi:hypothetical protein [Actinobacillus equuli]|uniref:hypothetical protein n=1 Tax=Actinobacillus equuli TaxID=718 RepID=UPI002440F8B9|nr:hypothetical protein [Actinobacillus equuli]WGE43014.1 hypothetical protein NYR64_04005 [Actinobacillus equuli subsp. haemolyticus]WGE47408.1 hypothetical protein NYR84_04215 [Actinobacillus equuli subsp. haemolyticus]WGE51626.1 hypothetical protein NYR68_04355 [Actinobacillus equuli subsp. haemolyticus]WGE53731.1 hypothetical protein NYR69_03995 [Actinobacillus equuli subsp. haemolyticus]WGE59909.1 hypothetical protein NYR73_04085 [Actinobacillus equuli subsp. haemolyticus]
MRTFITTLLTMGCAVTSYVAEGWNSILFGWAAFTLGLLSILFALTRKGERLVEEVADNQLI